MQVTEKCLFAKQFIMILTRVLLNRSIQNIETRGDMHACNVTVSTVDD